MGYQKLPGISPCKMSQDKYWCQQNILCIISRFLSEDQLNWTELRKEARSPVCAFFHLQSLKIWVCFIFSSIWLRLLRCFEGLIWKNIAEYDKIDLRNKRVKSAFLGNKKHFSNFLGFVCFYICLNIISSYWNQNTYLQERTQTFEKGLEEV